VLHQEAVRLMKQNPELIRRATETLSRWRAKGSSHSQELWDEWVDILNKRAWRRALAHTHRAQQLRQASPLATILPKETRSQILDDVQRLKSAAPRTRTLALAENVDRPPLRTRGLSMSPA